MDWYVHDPILDRNSRYTNLYAEQTVPYVHFRCKENQKNGSNDEVKKENDCISHHTTDVRQPTKDKKDISDLLNALDSLASENWAKTYNFTTTTRQY